MAATNWRSLRLRLVSAIVAIPLLLALTLAGDVWFLAAVAAAGLWALTEWYGLLEQGGHRPFSVVGLIGATALLVDVYFGSQQSVAILVTTGIAALIGVALRTEPGDAISDWALTLGGIVYCSLLLSFFLLLRALPSGDGWVLAVLLGTFATDSAAFFVGRSIGRRKLAPNISPGKTVEGAIGGLIASIASYLFLTLAAGLLTNWLHAVVLGVVVGMTTQLGDLAESAFKRSVRAKDASATIPGHGGMLDRIDSLVVAGVVVYYLLQILRVA